MWVDAPWEIRFTQCKDTVTEEEKRQRLRKIAREIPEKCTEGCAYDKNGKVCYKWEFFLKDYDEFFSREAPAVIRYDSDFLGQAETRVTEDLKNGKENGIVTVDDGLDEEITDAKAGWKLRGGAGKIFVGSERQWMTDSIMDGTMHGESDRYFELTFYDKNYMRIEKSRIPRSALENVCGQILNDRDRGVINL